MLGPNSKRARVAALVASIGLVPVAIAIGPMFEAMAAAGAAAMPAPGWLGPEAQQALDAVAARLDGMVRRGYERQPAAMLAIAGAAAVPMVAIAAWGSRLIRRMNGRAGGERGQIAAEKPVPLQAAGNAWIEIENRGEMPVAIGELTRIGRSDDCDLALGDAGVDHTHALIRRTSDSEFIIIDVSAENGAGVAVNGQRLRQGTLRDGDRIDLGAACVLFHQAQYVDRAEGFNQIQHARLGGAVLARSRASVDFAHSGRRFGQRAGRENR